MKRYSDTELNEFKEIIETKLSKTMEELTRLKEEITESQPGTKSFEDSAEQTLKDELTIMAARQEKLAGELNAALMRIGNKTYGICRVTGELIQKDRLRMVPHTTISMEGAKLQG